MCFCGDPCKVDKSEDHDTYRQRYWMCANFAFEPTIVQRRMNLMVRIVSRTPGGGGAGSAGGEPGAAGAGWWSAAGEGRGGAARPPWSRGQRGRVGAGERGRRGGSGGREGAGRRGVDECEGQGGETRRRGQKNGDRLWRLQNKGGQRQDLWRRPPDTCSADAMEVGAKIYGVDLPDTSQPARPPRQADRRQKYWRRHTEARRQ
jgi:hypothetical protein